MIYLDKHCICIHSKCVYIFWGHLVCLAFSMKIDHFDVFILKVARNPTECGHPSTRIFTTAELSKQYDPEEFSFSSLPGESGIDFVGMVRRSRSLGLCLCCLIRLRPASVGVALR